MRPWVPALHAYAYILMLFSLLFLVPTAASWWRADGSHTLYEEAMAVAFAAGALLWAATRRYRRPLRPADGFLIVALTWVVSPLFAAIPLYLYRPELGYVRAYFEAVSGLTTTGATVYSGLDDFPFSLNLWRAFLHWVGGMGVVVLAVAILPLLGIGGRQVFQAESPTPLKEESLTPRVADTAKGLWLTYAGMTLLCMGAFWYGGMSIEDAVIHAFSVMGLGGFSSHDASFGYFHSLTLELIAIAFATLAGFNWATHYLALVRRSAKPYWRDPELPYYLGVLAFSSLMLAAYLTVNGAYADFWRALRDTAFHVVSIATSLGLATTDYTLWPFFAQLWLLFLGSFTACAGSTGGGIKMMRAIILYKQIYREIVRALHPNAVVPVRLRKTIIENRVVFAVLGFSFLYMVSIVTLTLILSASGLDIVTAFSAVVACINNTGPGLGAVGPAANYGWLNEGQTLLLTFTMVLGRLEIFTFLVVLTPAFWRR
ncbi:Trk system potassium uptake protein [Hydrogenophilus thermoluteolus]|uniref:TrkH family potassium uptake protein n=1 Tax=Hydrogenophilus thermoluteolus TaxID=297 RepID=UPI0024A1D6D5|nr:potassium transporter TrkG [Hydrogenophilus thermoluteolus]GLW60486.1 Trk system potassium uptake protein [Hydrogenophilus thermoluteolus]